ncbi:MAG: cell envelope integrity protein TolA [Alphaproteobacteria bacterium]
MNELDALRSQLRACWSVPLGWTDPSEVRVVLRLFLNPDGTVAGQPRVVETPSGRYSTAAPESALRAVRRCAPYNLPREKYAAWKEILVHFDPVDMGGV